MNNSHYIGANDRGLKDDVVGFLDVFRPIGKQLLILLVKELLEVLEDVENDNNAA